MPRDSGASNSSLARRLRGDIDPVQVDGAATRFHETGQHLAQGRLAGSVGAHQRRELARAHLEVDVEEHLGLAVGGADRVYPQGGLRALAVENQVTRGRGANRLGRPAVERGRSRHLRRGRSSGSRLPPPLPLRLPSLLGAEGRLLGEGKDAVGVLGHVHRPQAEEHFGDQRRSGARPR